MKKTYTLFGLVLALCAWAPSTVLAQATQNIGCADAPARIKDLKKFLRGSCGPKAAKEAAALGRAKFLIFYRDLLYKGLNTIMLEADKLRPQTNHNISPEMNRSLRTAANKIDELIGKVNYLAKGKQATRKTSTTVEVLMADLLETCTGNCIRNGKRMKAGESLLAQLDRQLQTHPANELPELASIKTEVHKFIVTRRIDNTAKELDKLFFLMDGGTEDCQDAKINLADLKWWVTSDMCVGSKRRSDPSQLAATFPLTQALNELCKTAEGAELASCHLETPGEDPSAIAQQQQVGAKGDATSDDQAAPATTAGSANVKQ